VRPQDKELFFSFLRELKQALGAKTLSIAVPALTGPHPDAYDYREISTMVDRVIIMAYDQHWSTSKPGPIASPDWCKQVSDFALTQISKEKLIMGLPFYGRSWQNEDFSKAYKFSSVEKLLQDNRLSVRQTPEGIPYALFTKKIKVSLFFENVPSVLTKLHIYRHSSIQNVAFWRIGQENPEIWSFISSHGATK